MTAYGFHTSPGYAVRLKARYENLERGKVELKKNIHTIEACIEQLNKEITDLISEILQFGNSQTSKLHDLRKALSDDIDASIAEAEATLYMESPHLSTKYADLLRDAEDFEIVKCKFNREAVLAALQARLVTVEVEAVAGVVGKLPVIHGNEYEVLNVKNQKSITGVINGEKVTDGAVFTMVNRKMIVGAGGRPATVNAFVLDASNGEIAPIAQMGTSRGFPGAIRVDKFFYLFGGFDHSKGHPDHFLTACEKLNLETLSWHPLPSMKHPRHLFSPCLYEGEIYLPEVCNDHGVMESFNIRMESFRVVPVRLPIEGENSVSFVVDGELVLISYSGKIARWRINSSEKTLNLINFKNEGNKPQSNVSPIVHGNEVFFVHFSSGKVNVFDLKTATLRIRK